MITPYTFILLAKDSTPYNDNMKGKTIDQHIDTL